MGGALIAGFLKQFSNFFQPNRLNSKGARKLVCCNEGHGIRYEFAQNFIRTLGRKTDFQAPVQPSETHTAQALFLFTIFCAEFKIRACSCNTHTVGFSLFSFVTDLYSLSSYKRKDMFHKSHLDSPHCMWLCMLFLKFPSTQKEVKSLLFTKRPENT